MNIALDMMGGDYAPLEAVKGIIKCLPELPTDTILQLIGREDDISNLLAEHHLNGHRQLQVIHAPEVIGYNEHPVKALKEKRQSSIAVGFGLLAAGKTDAFASAGNTGAMLVGSMFALKTTEGVLRPTIGTIIPRENGKAGLLLDAGFNTDCKPENLNQFAIMGAAYSNIIWGIDNPRVGLLNVGEEEGKGNILAQAAYPLLKENTAINFIGNIEGRDVLEDKADVIVCDGFTGNIILKLLESLHPITKRQEIHHPYFDRFNFEQYGGIPVLGIEKPVIIAHGVSQAEAFSNIILSAVRIIETDFLNKLKGKF